MPEHVDELSSFVRIKLQQPSLTAINHTLYKCIQVSFLSLMTISESSDSNVISKTTISFQVESVKSSIYSPVHKHTADTQFIVKGSYWLWST